MKKYARLLRLNHAMKNLLIFLPLLFSGRMLEWALLARTIAGFAAFCCVSSAVYIFNDIRDVENDRRHSTKRLRPIASGEVSLRAAWCWLVGMLALAAGIQLCMGASGWTWAPIALYLALNAAYSMGCKNVPILDITLLASGFLLRLLYGSALTEIEISNWLYLTVIAMSFYLGLGKRRNEMAAQIGTRKVLAFYTIGFLDKNMYLCLALTITFYSLWSVDPLTLARISHRVGLVWTVPLVILICMKYSLHIEGESSGDPVDVVLSDKGLLLLVAVFGAVTLLLIYV